MQMDAIVTRLKEIDSAAAAILDHTAEAKQELQERMQKKTLEFDQELSQKTKTSIDAGKAQMDAQIERELRTLTADTQKQIQAIKSNYEQHQDQIAGEIFEQVTGQKWPA
jgi:ABC-type phosphate transport system auxiliary subunit